MIIGNGMIAKRFSTYAEDDQWLIFASGVSHSLSVHEEEFARERALLQTTLQNHRDNTLVYFSTCSIYDPSLQQSAYVLHKLDMEALIQSAAKRYLIFRVSNPVGRTNNQHTVLNYFVSHICSGIFFTVWKHASRNLLDIDDMFTICDHLMRIEASQNKVINIANPNNYSVKAIVNAIEDHFNKKGHFEFAEKGNSPRIDVTAILPLLSELKIEFGQNYMKRMLRKYFPVP